MADDSLTRPYRLRASGKTCSRCDANKPRTREFFSNHKTNADGLHSTCKECLAADRRRQRAEQPERFRAIEARRRERHRVKLIEKSRRYYSERGHIYRENAKERIERTREEANRRAREKIAANREENREKQRKWREENRDRLRGIYRDRYREMSPQQRLRHGFGCSISRSIKKAIGGLPPGYKRPGWQQILGYTKEELFRHLERQFRPGMTWENYGTYWHIDHIIPASSFKYESVDDPEFHACWALTNLQPLEKIKNIQKSNRRTHLL